MTYLFFYSILKRTIHFKISTFYVMKWFISTQVSIPYFKSQVLKVFISFLKSVSSQIISYKIGLTEGVFIYNIVPKFKEFFFVCVLILNLYWIINNLFLTFFAAALKASLWLISGFPALIRWISSLHCFFFQWHFLYKQ